MSLTSLLEGTRVKLVPLNAADTTTVAVTGYKRDFNTATLTAADGLVFASSDAQVLTVSTTGVATERGAA